MAAPKKAPPRLYDTGPLSKPGHSITRGRTRALDGKYGGQQSMMADHRHWMSSATYVRQKMITVLYEAPGHMMYMDDGLDRIRLLKAIMETMPTAVQGLTRKLEAEYSEHKINDTNEVHHTPTRVSRAVSTVSIVIPEKHGKFVFNYMSQWLIELIYDPETTHPGLVNKIAYQSAGYPEFLPDAIAMTCLFYEPSVDMARITEAYLVVNMMPKSSGEDEAKNIVGEANETVEQTIEFTGTTTISDHVDVLAQNHLDELMKKGARPHSMQAAYIEIEPGVKNNGEDYTKKLQAVAETPAAVIVTPGP